MQTQKPDLQQKNTKNKISFNLGSYDLFIMEWG